MKVSAVIVAKATSLRLKNKNMLPFGESTVLGHKINQLKQCERINEVIVGSDCDKILEYSESLGAVPIKRPEKYCDESVSVANDMIKNMMSLIKRKDVILWAHCTNPNIQPETYDKAIETYENSLNKPIFDWVTDEYFDSLVSVDKVQEHLWKIYRDEYGRPYNFRPWNEPHPFAKDLPPFWKQNGAIFIQSYKNMKENNYFFAKHPYLFETPTEESHDINSELDYHIAQTINEKYF